VVTHAEMNESSNAMACKLRRLSILKGTLVGFFLFNFPEFLVIWFVLAQIDIILVPINVPLRRFGLM